MENAQEKNYFIIWLYISILLHVLVVIIMLSIKPTTPNCKDPDPASIHFQPAQVILVADEPVEKVSEEQIKEDFKLAKREQGGSIALEQPQQIKQEAVQDMPTQALSLDYKHGLQNQTDMQEQDDEGHVNILKDAVIGQEEQKEKQIINAIEHKEKAEILKENTKQAEQSLSGNIKALVAEKIENRIETKTSHTTQNKEQEQHQIQKVISKKHRPADLGQENLSKIQLSKPDTETAAPKKKISLQDLQNGFSEFIRNGTTVQTNAVPTASVLGNSLFFSTDGNSDKDDIAGLKRASYMHQIGQMYQNAGREYVDNIVSIVRKEGIPAQNNYIAITIERSGKISNAVTIQSCGNNTIDQYHLKAIDAIGDFPPIPKYIQAPMHIKAYLPFENKRTIPIKTTYR